MSDEIYQLEDNIKEDQIDRPKQTHQLSDYATNELLLSEAVRRIEQAKLYEALLKNRLFEFDSNNSEIVAIVEKEIKTFILSRLEVLLGIKPSNKETDSRMFTQVFTSEEISVLKQLANKFLEKHTVRQSEPAINPVPVKNLNKPAPVKTGKQSGSKNNNQSNSQQTIKRRSNNVSEVTGQDYSQAVPDPSLGIKPMPMPTQEQMNQLAAIESTKMRSVSDDANNDILSIAIHSIVGKMSKSDNT